MLSMAGPIGALEANPGGLFLLLLLILPLLFLLPLPSSTFDHINNPLTAATDRCIFKASCLCSTLRSCIDQRTQSVKAGLADAHQYIVSTSSLAYCTGLKYAVSLFKLVVGLCYLAVGLVVLLLELSGLLWPVIGCFAAIVFLLVKMLRNLRKSWLSVIITAFLLLSILYGLFVALRFTAHVTMTAYSAFSFAGSVGYQVVYAIYSTPVDVYLAVLNFVDFCARSWAHLAWFGCAVFRNGLIFFCYLGWALNLVFSMICSVAAVLAA